MYKVTYIAEDADYNRVEASRIILVTDGSYVPVGEYALFAEDFTIDSSEVNPQAASIIASANAQAWKIDTGNPVRVELEIVAIPSDYQKGCEAGDYTIIFRVAENPSLTKSVTATVKHYEYARITFEDPLVLEGDPDSTGFVSRAQLLEGVTAYNSLGENFASAIKLNPDAAGNEVMPQIPLNVAGDYEVIYSVSDNFGNVNVRHRVVTIEVKEEDPPLPPVTSIQIFARDKIEIDLDQAWDIAYLGPNSKAQFDRVLEEDLLNAYGVRTSKGEASATPIHTESITPAFDNPFDFYYGNSIYGYADSGRLRMIAEEFTFEGRDYVVTIQADEDPAQQRNAIITVLPWTTVEENIVANHFDIEKHPSALDIMNLPIAERDQWLIDKANVQGRLSASNAYGTAPVEVVSTNILADGKTGGMYEVTFRVVGSTDEGSQVTVEVFAWPPPSASLLVSSPIEIWIGDPAEKPAGALLPGEFSVLRGVMAYIQDTDVLLIVQPFVEGAVDETKAGIYPLKYSVTPFSAGGAEATRVVVVNDGNYTVGDEYILYAEDFEKQASEVNAAAEAILADAKAQAWKVDQAVAGGVSPANVVVSSVARSYQANCAGGDYSIGLCVAEDDTVQRNVVASVIGSGGGYSAVVYPPILATCSPDEPPVSVEEFVAQCSAEDPSGAFWIESVEVSFPGREDSPAELNVGLCKVVVEKTNAQGDRLVETHLLIVDDGRYTMDFVNGIIVGARDCVVPRSSYGVAELQVRNLSFVEAYDLLGNPLEVVQMELPVGSDGLPAVGDHVVNFIVEGKGGVVIAPITVHVVEAETVENGDRESQYAIAGSKFVVTPEKAQAMLDQGVDAFIEAAGVKVFPLVRSATAKAARLVSSGDFAAEEGVYLCVFAVEGLEDVLKIGVAGIVQDWIVVDPPGPGPDDEPGDGPGSGDGDREPTREMAQELILATDLEMVRELTLGPIQGLTLVRTLGPTQVQIRGLTREPTRVRIPGAITEDLEVQVDRVVPAALPQPSQLSSFIRHG